MTDTITEAQLIERLKEAGLYSEPWGEELKSAKNLEVGDLFLTGKGNDTVLFEIKKIVALSAGTARLVGTYGEGGQLHKAAIIVSASDRFTILVPPAN